jgi:hypothetical protein
MRPANSLGMRTHKVEARSRLKPTQQKFAPTKGAKRDTWTFGSCWRPRRADAGPRVGLHVVIHDLSAPYRSGPSRDWLKIKKPVSPAMIRAREADWS